MRRAVVLLYTCPKCAHVTRLNKRWTGPTPPGGFHCTAAAACGHVHTFAEGVAEGRK